MNRQAHHQAHEHEITKVVKRNKWALGYISAVTTVGLIIKIYELVRG